MANDQAWGLNLAEIDSPDANVRLFHYRILDKTYRVTLVQNDNITDTDWISKKLEEANNSHERKYTLCVHGYWIQGSSFDHPDTFLFSFCCGSDILIWRTRRMGNMMYTYEIDSFLSNEKVSLITEQRSEEALREYFGLLRVEMRSVAKVYEQKMLQTRNQVTHLNRRLGRCTTTAGNTVHRFLQNYEASSSNAQVSLDDELCKKIVGLDLPSNFHVVPQLSTDIHLDVSQVPRAVVEDGAMKASLLFMLMSSLSF